MGLSVSYESDTKGITVPYPSLRDEIRNNRGFIDLRGKPEAAANVAEGIQSAGLRQLLIDLARQNSPLFTLGCDIGSHREKRTPKYRREVAGGYVQVIAAAYTLMGPEKYRAFAEAVAAAMDAAVGVNNWSMTFILVAVQLNLDNFDDIVPSVWIWFWAHSSTAQDAIISREHLLAALRSALLSDSIVRLINAGSNIEKQPL